MTIEEIRRLCEDKKLRYTVRMMRNGWTII